MMICEAADVVTGQPVKDAFAILGARRGARRPRMNAGVRIELDGLSRQVSRLAAPVKDTLLPLTLFTMRSRFDYWSRVLLSADAEVLWLELEKLDCSSGERWDPVTRASVSDIWALEQFLTCDEIRRANSGPVKPGKVTGALRRLVAEAQRHR